MTTLGLPNLFGHSHREKKWQGYDICVLLLTVWPKPKYHNANLRNWSKEVQKMIVSRGRESIQGNCHVCSVNLGAVGHWETEEDSV